MDHPVVRAGVSLGGLGAIANGVMQWLTPALTFLGLLLAALWYSAELYESKFVQDWLAKRKAKKAAARILEGKADEPPAP